MLTLIALVLGFVHVALAIVYLYLTWYHKYWDRRGLVTAKPLSLLGSYPGLLTRKTNLVDDAQKVYDKYKGKHRAVGVFMTRVPQLMILDPELAHEVLVLNFRSFRDSLPSAYVPYAKKDKYARRNAFWATGESWRRMRSEAQGGLSANRLKQGFAIWQESGKKLLDYMARQANKHDNKLETRDLCFRYTADVMCDFIWGIDAGTLTRDDEQPNKVLEIASKWTGYAFYMLSIFMATFIAPFLRILLSMRFYPKETDDFFSNLTRESIELRLKAKNGTQRADYLSHMLKLQAERQLSHDDLVGHALTVLLDGYDTTATALLHALYYLSENPAAQQKLRMEILNNTVDNISLTFDQLCELPYLEQVVYESLRLSSLIPQYTKVCTSPTKIQLSEHSHVEVEEGITVMIPNYQFHHDAKYFPDPEAFKPERFDNGAHHELIRKGIFLPFSDGPRICMGQRLAQLTLKIALYHIIRNYQILKSSQKATIAGDSGFGVVLQGDINLEYCRILK